MLLYLTEDHIFFCHLSAQAQYNARRAGITSAIVIAILIPVGICGFCLILKLRENAAERSAAKTFVAQPADRFERAGNNYDYVDNTRVKSSSSSSLNKQNGRASD